MISMYSGTPGSGKGVHVANEIYDLLRMNRTVISNIMIDLDLVAETLASYYTRKVFKKAKIKKRSRIGTYIYKDFSELSPDYLIEHAQKNHKIGKEGQTLLIVDECAVLFNSRNYAAKDRMSWIKFFQIHRHLGYNIILVSQHDRLIDRQIRAFIETEHRHRALDKYGTLGWIITLVLMRKMFLSIETWYGVKNITLGKQLIVLNKRKANIYNTCEMFARTGTATGAPEPATGGTREDPRPEQPTPGCVEIHGSLVSVDDNNDFLKDQETPNINSALSQNEV